MTTLGYLRVSTIDQDLEKNKADILRLANEKQLGHVTWIEEKVSGTKDWRKRKLGEALSKLKEGDTLLVPELSRLGRSTLQILEIIREAKEKGIAVHAVKGGWSLNGTMESKIVLHMLAMFSEIERDLISERTKEGVRKAWADGKQKGRPKGSKGTSVLDGKEDEIRGYLLKGVSLASIAKIYMVGWTTMSHFIKTRRLSPAIQ